MAELARLNVHANLELATTNKASFASTIYATKKEPESGCVRLSLRRVEDV